MKIQTTETNYNWIELLISDGSTEISVVIDDREAEDFSHQLLSALHDTYRLMNYDEKSIKKSLEYAGITG